MKQEIIHNIKNLFFAVLALAVIITLSMYFDGKNVLEEGGLTKLQKTENTYKDISPEIFNAMLQLKNTNDFFLLDVHVPESEHIVGTDAYIPYTDITAKQSSLPANKNKMIVVYCRSGRMSQIAAQKLNMLGYKNVFNLKGGTDAFKERGFSSGE